MTPARLDILTSALTEVARLIMGSRTDRDAAALRNQLRAMGPAQRSDVDSIEADARRRLADDAWAGGSYEVGGPLDEGD